MMVDLWDSLAVTKEPAIGQQCRPTIPATFVTATAVVALSMAGKLSRNVEETGCLTAEVDL